MSRHPSILATKDRYNFVLDQVSTLLRVSFLNGCHFNSFSGVEFNTRGRYYRKLKDLKTKIVIRIMNGNIFVECRVNFNFNRALRDYYSNLLDFHRFRSIYEFGPNCNVIPSELRLELKRWDIGIPEVREKGYELFFKHVNEVRQEMSNHLYAVTRISVAPEEIKWCFETVEIDNDIMLQPSRDLTAEERIIAKFNEVVNVRRGRQFSSNGESSFAFTPGELTQAWSTSADRKPPSLDGLCESDKSSKSYYLKEYGPNASVFRAETRFEGHVCFKKHFGGNTIFDEEDFKKKINHLAELAFAIDYKILNEPSFLTDRQKMEQLRFACIAVGGRNHGYEIYKAFKKGHGSIHTGSRGAAPFAVARKIGELHRKGELVKIKEQSGRRGIYVPDWDWILLRWRKP